MSTKVAAMPAAAGAAPTGAPAPAVAPAQPAVATAGLPSLQRRCLHLLASALVARQLGEGKQDEEGASLQAGMRSLPQELQLELLLLLASWQLLDNAACELLASCSSCTSGSVLAGAASVSLAGCVLVGRASLHRQLLCCPLPQLVRLSLKGLLWLEDDDVARLLPHCPSLRHLDLSKCPQLTAAAVAAVTSSTAAPQIQSLALAGCWQVAALPGLQACTQLTALNLSGCWQLTDSSVRQVLAALPRVEELALNGCSQLGNGILVSAARPAGPSLRAAGIRVAVPAVDGGGPAQLAGGRPAAIGAAAAAVAAEAAAVAAGQGRAEALAFADAEVGHVRRRLQALGAERDAEAGVDEEEEADEGQDVEGRGLEEALQDLCFPLDGVQLPKLRSLDMSGTAAGDCLLYWLAQSCCCRLQRLVLTGTRVTGLGLSALLAAKRALLHHQCCPGRQHATAKGDAAPTSALAEQPEPPAVLPLLELAAGGTAAFGASAPQHALPTMQLRAVQQQWEAAQGGGLCLQLPCSTSGSSSSSGRRDRDGGGEVGTHAASSSGRDGSSSSSSPPTHLTLSLLSEPPDETCPFCSEQQGTAAAAVGAGSAWPAVWPPDSQAGVLSALGPPNLRQLQALDVSGSGGCVELANLIADTCSSLQRMRLAGCRTLGDGSMACMLRSLPLLRELDVSGCTGSRTARPGSRFLRHKAPRLQEGGVTDASLCLLGRPCEGGPASYEVAACTVGTETAAAEAANTAGGAAGTLPGAAAAPVPTERGLQLLNAGALSITDATLRSLPASLTSLQLRGCKRVGDSGLLQLLAQCPALARMDVGSCSQLTTAGFGCYTPFGSGQVGQLGQMQLQLQGAQAGSEGEHQAACSTFGGWEEQQQAEGRGLQSCPARKEVGTVAAPPAGPSLSARAGGSSAPQQAASQLCLQTQGPSPPADGASVPGTCSVANGAVGGSGSDAEAEAEAEQQGPFLRAMQQVVSTAAGVQLQRAVLPRQACSREVLAWLAGQARNSSSSSSSGASGGSCNDVNTPAGCSPCQRLELASCASLAEGSLLALATCCPQLKSLQLGGAGLTAGSRLCAALTQRCRLLSRLTLSDCASLADAELAQLLQQLPALQHLELSGCTALTGSAFYGWAQQGQQGQQGQLGQGQPQRSQPQTQEEGQRQSQPTPPLPPQPQVELAGGSQQLHRSPHHQQLGQDPSQQEGQEGAQHRQGELAETAGAAVEGDAAAAPAAAAAGTAVAAAGAGGICTCYNAGSGPSRGGGSQPGGAPGPVLCLLRTLRLEGCAVDDAAALALVAACPHLEVLSLRRCKRLTGRAGAAALCRCRALRQLLLGGTGVADCSSDAELAAWWAAAAQPAPSAGQAEEEGREVLAATAASTAVPLPTTPRPSMLALVELPPRAVRHSPRWQRLLGLLGEPKLVYAD